MGDAARGSVSVSLIVTEKLLPALPAAFYEFDRGRRARRPAAAREVEVTFTARRPHHALEAPALRARRARLFGAEPGALVERRGWRDLLAADGPSLVCGG